MMTPRALERQRVIDALQASHGVQTKAARMLGMTTSALKHRRRIFKLDALILKPDEYLGYRYDWANNTYRKG